MKKILVLLAAMAMTFGANAQIVESKSKVVKYEAATPKSGYNRIMFNYTPTFVTPSISDVSGDGQTLQGGGMSYTRGISVSSKLPMFVEVGIGAQFGTGDVFEGSAYDPYYGYSTRIHLGLNLLRVNVPVAFTYRFAFGSDKQIKISPFVGLNFGVNIVTDDDKNGHYDLFKDYNYDDDNYQRFQMGMLFGANFTFKRFNLQVAYTLDFMPLYSQDASTRSVWVNGYYGYAGNYISGYSYDITTPEIKGKTGTLTIGIGWEF